MLIFSNELLAWEILFFTADYFNRVDCVNCIKYTASYMPILRAIYEAYVPINSIIVSYSDIYMCGHMYSWLAMYIHT